MRAHGGDNVARARENTGTLTRPLTVRFGISIAPTTHRKRRGKKNAAARGGKSDHHRGAQGALQQVRAREGDPHSICGIPPSLGETHTGAGPSVPSGTGHSDPAVIDTRCADFDGVLFHLVTGESKTVLYLSIAWKCWAELRAAGAEDILRAEYGSLVVDPLDGNDFSLRIDLTALPPTPAERGTPWCPPFPPSGVVKAPTQSCVPLRAALTLARRRVARAWAATRFV